MKEILFTALTAIVGGAIGGFLSVLIIKLFKKGE